METFRRAPNAARFWLDRRLDQLASKVCDPALTSVSSALAFEFIRR